MQQAQARGNGHGFPAYTDTSSVQRYPYNGTLPDPLALAARNRYGRQIQQQDQGSPTYPDHLSDLDNGGTFSDELLRHQNYRTPASEGRIQNHSGWLRSRASGSSEYEKAKSLSPTPVARQQYFMMQRRSPVRRLTRYSVRPHRGMPEDPFPCRPCWLRQRRCYRHSGPDAPCGQCGTSQNRGKCERNYALFDLQTKEAFNDEKIRLLKSRLHNNGKGST